VKLLLMIVVGCAVMATLIILDCNAALIIPDSLF